MKTERIIVNNKPFLKGITIPYFRFKTNAILDYRNGARIAGTYVDKTKEESIYDLVDIITEDTEGDIAVVSGMDEKSLIANQYSSYPLQRVDKLIVYDLASLFLYINGKKIPDNEIFVYTNRSFTDIFIPTSYLGDITNSNANIEDVITIDYRQAGSEELYYRDSTFSGDTLTINLKDPAFDYVDSVNKPVCVENLIIYVNGYLQKAKSVSKSEDGILTIKFDKFISADVELYILNNIIYRSIPEDSELLNINENKLHFYLNDDYFVDIISGPITKSAVSFFYDSKRVDDSLITQTSRFSFEFNINIENFNPKLVDFFIEDIGWRIDDFRTKSYGDDYYLLNMLGVKRCVDKMRGYKSYSIFDDPLFNISFKKTLSNNGELFDVIKANNKYTNLDYQVNSPSERAKYLIKERPTLLREFQEHQKIPSKRFIVVGNKEDVVTSSVTTITDPKQEVYYKIYVNHSLISTAKYTTKRDVDHDIITIDKSVLKPENDADEIEKFGNSINEIEITQYDMTYKDKSVYLEYITNGFTEYIEPDGSKSYVKTYMIDDLPFGSEFVYDDICAIEKIDRKWFNKNNKEYYYMYPSKEYYGYRMVKSFNIVEKTDELITIKLQMHDYINTEGKFFLMCKQYNVTEEYVITNEDDSYYLDNDIVKPIYSSFVEYGRDKDGNKYVKEVYNYIPYINNSEPIVQQNGKELIYGEKYTYHNPSTNDSLACSFLILKQQPAVGDVFTLMFNSNKTNILIVGYDNLNIDNRYGLIYLSELKYPISTESMNIIVNGEKLSAYDVDILSDKLIRVHHIYRPITSLLITTNSKYKDIEIADWISLYKESEFELLLEKIFNNCDPSKKFDANYPIVDYVYKMDPYYTDFVGSAGKDYDNPYYDEYIDFIYEHKFEFDRNSVWELIQKEPNVKDLEKHEAWVNAGDFFAIYKWNHGFVEDVDSVKQKENPLEGEKPIYETDALIVMYLNWLARSKKTRTYGFKAEDIDPIVLKYFSVYQNTVVDNRMDIVVYADKVYEGLQDCINEPIRYNWDEDNPKPIYQYPGAQTDLRRRFFWNIFLTCFEEKENENIIENASFVSGLTDDNELNILESMQKHSLSNILYPRDFPIEPDANGIRWTGTNVDIVTSDPQITLIEKGD